MNEVVQQKRAWGAVVLWLAFQLSLTSLPGSALPPLPGFRIDWIAHFCMYFGLGFLFARVWWISGRRIALLPLVWVGMAAFGLLDELHEKFIPGRGYELMDLLMDACGSAAGLASGTFMMRIQWAARLLR